MQSHNNTSFVDTNLVIMSFQPLDIKYCCFLLFVWADCFTILGLVLGRRVSQAALPPWKRGGGGGGRAFFRGVRCVEDSVLIKPFDNEVYSTG